MQYRQGKRGQTRQKVTNWLRLAAKRGEDSSTQRQQHVMVSRQFLH